MRYAWMLLFIATTAMAQPPQDSMAVPVRMVIIGHYPLDDNCFRTDVKDTLDADAKYGVPTIGCFQSLNVSVARWTDEWLDGLAHKDAAPNDTLIVYTLGHGGGDGTMLGLGPRRDMLERLAGVCGRTKQRILWWQANCHAEAGTNYYYQLPYEQTQYLIVYNGSRADSVSWTGREAPVFAALFERLQKNRSMNMEEFQEFLQQNDDPNATIFGMARKIGPRGYQSCDWLKGWRGQKIFGQ